MSEMDEKLGSMNMKARSYIRLIIQEKTDAITKLEVENMMLKNKIKHMDIDSQRVSNQFSVLDKAVEETLASITQDDLYESAEEGLLAMKTRLIRLEEMTTELAGRKAHLEQVEVRLEEQVVILTDENAFLREELEEIQVEYNVTKKELAHEVDTLMMSVNEGKHNLALTKEKARVNESMYRKTVASLHSEVRLLLDQVQDLKRMLRESEAETHKIKAEMNEVEGRARKLLTSIGLGNDCESLSLMLDHARNLHYAKRKKGGVSSRMSSSYENLDPEQYRRSSIMRSENVDAFPGLRSTAQSRKLNHSPIPSTIVSSPINGESYKERTASGDNLENVNVFPEISFENSTKFKKSSMHLLGTSSPTLATSSPNLRAVSPINGQPQRERRASIDYSSKSTCAVCDKEYDDISNFEGACLHHAEGATKVNPGTTLEVWSCCMSRDTYRGCVKSRHIPCN